MLYISLSRDLRKFPDDPKIAEKFGAKSEYQLTISPNLKYHLITFTNISSYQLATSTNNS